MANYEFGTLKTLKKFIDKEANSNDRYSGNVLLPGFNFDEEVEYLKASIWTTEDIIDYIVASNPVLYALM